MKDNAWIQIVFDMITVFSTVLTYSPGTGFLANEPKPEFLPSSRNVTVERGDMAVLPCRVSNLGKRQVAWRRMRDNRFLTVGTLTWIKDSRLVVEYIQPNPKVSEWNLLIKNVQKSSAGRYECQITSMKRSTHTVQLNVIDPKPVRTLFTERHQHDMKSSLSETKESPQPEIQYKKHRNRNSEVQVPDFEYKSGQLQTEEDKSGESGNGKSTVSLWCMLITVFSIIDLLARTTL
ncbi:uncharacterized protein LOC121378371 [Gigantopelta aegis]|uniref:uncharacterized protein LOC121378371 n=1 Tax=Gigantopelta aegis TaxID=1735272 RepID=UPI001B8876BB|nr:uncharacterized protein LOC121378371 [Gigantopelta aegis]